MISLKEEGKGQSILFVDGEERRRISHSVISREDLRGLPLDDSIFGRLHELEVRGGIRYAMAALSRQALHSKKLERKLRDRNVEDRAIVAILDHCKASGWLDDESWQSSRVEQWQKKGKSAAQIRARLRADGISLSGRVDDATALRRLVERSYPELLDSSTSFHDKAKIYRALQRRGFSLESIRIFLTKSCVDDGMGFEIEIS